MFDVQIGQIIPHTKNISDNKDYYCDLLVEICKSKFGDDYEKRFINIIRWLESTDFFEAPASSQFHEPYPGGLVEHTLRVYNNLIVLMQSDLFKGCDVISATLCALVHDWCKIGLYEGYMKNVKNPDTGMWEQVEAYKRTDPLIPLGHGTTSMYMAMRFFDLTVEEALAIRWHMGEYHICNDERSELHAANESYPLVQLLQFADRMACSKFGI